MIYIIKATSFLTLLFLLVFDTFQREEIEMMVWLFPQHLSLLPPSSQLVCFVKILYIFIVRMLFNISLPFFLEINLIYNMTLEGMYAIE